MNLIHFSKELELKFDDEYINNMDEEVTYFYKDLTDSQIEVLEVEWADRYCHQFYLADEFDALLEAGDTFDEDETGVGFGFTEYTLASEHLSKLEKW